MNPIMQAGAAHVQQQLHDKEKDALARLREELLRLGVRGELRDNDTALMIPRPLVGLPVWVFVGYGGAFYSWQSAEKRHPVPLNQAA